MPNFYVRRFTRSFQVQYFIITSIFISSVQVKILYLKNLPSHIPCDRFHGFVRNLVGDSVIKVRKLQNYCFIHFFDRKSAEVAMTKFEGKFLPI